jgi:hypothetical protein
VPAEFHTTQRKSTAHPAESSHRGQGARRIPHRPNEVHRSLITLIEFGIQVDRLPPLIDLIRQQFPDGLVAEMLSGDVLRTDLIGTDSTTTAPELSTAEEIAVRTTETRARSRAAMAMRRPDCIR